MNLNQTLTYFKTTIQCKGKIIDLSTPKVMGILNITPDSFYDGGFYDSDKKILKQVEKMISEGMDILDIGAHSSRPGAKMLSLHEEKMRVKPVLKLLKTKFPELIISLDTFQSEVANYCVHEFGVDIINDISGGELDPKMFEVISELNVPYIMMHMRGTPENMQQHTYYEDVVVDIIRYFAEKIETLKVMGVKDIIIDPGFGFSKTIEQNFELLNRLDEFTFMGQPVLVGLSRKSMIYKALESDPGNALTGTIAAQTLALEKGARIIRVHDVKEAKELVKIMKFIAN